jgi:hypothetical protein
MTRVFLRGGLSIVLGASLAIACAQGSSSTGDDGGGGGGGGTPGDASADAKGGGGGGEGGSGDDSGMCMLGTITDCGSCGHACPAADMTSKPTCTDATSTATCDIECTGEHYDLDGNPTNGCEAEDLPIQDSATTAVPVMLPDANAKNIVAPMYGDKRQHDSDQAARMFGREDWYIVTASGASNASGMVACLSAVNFPSDDVLDVCITQNGSTTFDTAGCATYTLAADAGSACVQPNGMASNDLGTFYVRVRRTAGASNANQYALYLRH